MAWTTPKTDWAIGELVTAADMNAIGENLRILRSRESAAYTTPSNISARSNAFSDVDDENLNLTITTTGGDVLVHFSGWASRTGSNSRDHAGYYDVAVDENRLGDNDGILRVGLESGRKFVSFTHLLQDLSAGSHTFTLQWKNDVQHHNYHNLQAGAQFWVREV